ncbi:unnamed protein product [Rhodiola kirilowii]
MALKLFSQANLTPIIFRLRPLSILSKYLFPKPPFSVSFSITATRYPLYYEMVVSRPTQESLRRGRRRLLPSKSSPESPPPDEVSSQSDPGFDDWVDKKIAANQQKDKAKRKYYSRTARRMYGTDSEDEAGRDEDGFVELQPEVVEMRTLHQREEELFFYDAFCYPWEKDKHYKMVYQLEKKYFPDQCLDKAFLEPGQVSSNDAKRKVKRSVKVKAAARSASSGTEETKVEDDKGMVFFENEEKAEAKAIEVKDDEKDGLGKKVEDFFKTLKRVPGKSGEVSNSEPYLLTRSTGLPPRWDGPNGTVVLVNKPKGWTSFTVCGKLRRLVKVQKVGHAGTLDPMATGLLIVCIGKATKVVDSYQGMIKGYSGVFRLGEATSTWDADSPVIQREPWEHIKDDGIQKAAKTFCGEIFQVPPMFSAIKVGGEKMYEKARRGESIELSPRRISIFKFEVERSLSDRQNLIFRVTCSKGTYIRSLCCDFGKALGSCAHLTALRRDSIGDFSADDAWEFKELEEAIIKNYF